MFFKYTTRYEDVDPISYSHLEKDSSFFEKYTQDFSLTVGTCHYWQVWLGIGHRDLQRTRLV